MHKWLLASLCFIFSFSSLYAQEDEDSLDNAALNAEVHRLEPDLADSMNNISRQYYLVGNNESAYHYARLAEFYAGNAGYKRGLATAYIRMGDALYSNGEYDTAVVAYKEALQIDEETRNKIEQAAVLTYIAMALTQVKKYDEALEYTAKSLAVASGNADTDGMATAYSAEGNVYMYKKQYAEAGKYLDKALLLFKGIYDPQALSYTYFYLGQLDSARGNTKQSKKWFAMYDKYNDSIVNLAHDITAAATAREVHNNAVIDSMHHEQAEEDSAAKDNSSPFKLPTTFSHPIPIGIGVGIFFVVLLWFLRKNSPNV